MKLNRSYKYWEFFYDEDGNKDNGVYNEEDESDRQCFASFWSDEWHGVSEIYNMSDEELRNMLDEDIKYYNIGQLDSGIIKTLNNKEEYINYKPVNKRLIGYAIKELRKIKEECPLI